MLPSAPLGILISHVLLGMWIGTDFRGTVPLGHVRTCDGARRTDLLVVLILSDLSSCDLSGSSSFCCQPPRCPARLLWHFDSVKIQETRQGLIRTVSKNTTQQPREPDTSGEKPSTKPVKANTAEL
ncbi:Uncharacterized protein DAT39_015390 [Clarias magur]|uniref:Secreted protein n=1 Tax=Clarias magur TaxID=1594786 RepID=A0A8J4UI21_CLAMG|nr:Uncharacterized protein DAT39_015390 [Clarias magur]